VTTIAACAPHNELAAAQLLLRGTPDGSPLVTPKSAGWRYLSFQAQRIATPTTINIGDSEEAVIVIVSGGGLELVIDGRNIHLDGRADVFAGLPWAVYLPASTSVELVPKPAPGNSGVVIAVGQAPLSDASVHRELVVISPLDIDVEVRGSGNVTRLVNHIVKPNFPADRLLVVEVYTPAGNWSGWPAHKHDTDAMPAEAVLEETYYYQFRRAESWALQRLYRRDTRIGPPRNLTFEVRHGDLVVVTDGYHPFVANPADDAYYLNMLAGDRRTMACSTDPSLADGDTHYTTQPPDTRVSAAGR